MQSDATTVAITPALNIRIARFLFASTVSRKCHDVVTVKPCAQWTTLTAILTSDSLVVLLKTANEANAVYLGNVAIVPECIRNHRHASGTIFGMPYSIFGGLGRVIKNGLFFAIGFAPLFRRKMGVGEGYSVLGLGLS